MGRVIGEELGYFCNGEQNKDPGFRPSALFPPIGWRGEHPHLPPTNIFLLSIYNLFSMLPPTSPRLVSGRTPPSLLKPQVHDVLLPPSAKLQDLVDNNF